jgi:GTPase SAR1 family protein
MSLRRSKSFINGRRLVIVGSGMCGKTGLLIAFKDNQFLPKYEATIFETYVTNILIDEKNVSLLYK